MDEAVKEALAGLAEERGTSIAEVVRDALHEYVDRHVWSKTIGGTVVKLLRDGLDNEAVAAAVLKDHPTSRITSRTVSWHRTKARKEDPAIPTDREARSRPK